jgi:hypothetical protein
MGREVVVALTDGKPDSVPLLRIFYGKFDDTRPKRVPIKITGE